MAMSINEIFENVGNTFKQAARAIGDYPIDWDSVAGVIGLSFFCLFGLWLSYKLFQFLNGLPKTPALLNRSITQQHRALYDESKSSVAQILK
jgi:hypothetical protein